MKKNSCLDFLNNNKKNLSSSAKEGGRGLASIEESVDTSI